MHIVWPIDEITGNTRTVRKLPEPVRVGTGTRTYNYDDVALLEKLLNSVLAILGRVADVLLARRRQQREAAPKRFDYLGRVIHRQRRLGDEREIRRIPRNEFLHIRDTLDEIDVAAKGGIEPPHRSLDFRVAGMADQNNVTTLAGITLHFHVNLGHERASGIKHRESASPGFGLHVARNTVSGENDGVAGRNLLQLLDKHGTQSAQAVHHVGVVNDFVTHVNGPSEQFDRALHDVDRAIDSCAKAAWVGQKNFHRVSAKKPLTL